MKIRPLKKPIVRFCARSFSPRVTLTGPGAMPANGSWKTSIASRWANGYWWQRTRATALVSPPCWITIISCTACLSTLHTRAAALAAHCFRRCKAALPRPARSNARRKICAHKVFIKARLAGGGTGAKRSGRISVDALCALIALSK